jgi:excisionase family DNA binding protein
MLKRPLDEKVENQRMPEQPEIRWLTLEQAAERLQTTARSVGYLVKRGKLPAVHLSVKEGYRVRAQDVDMLATAQADEQKEI